ncbi:unnamed protein product [Lactuca saligna]|uniref:ABC transporter domain-containing protein n=1 Tax=Lactuca saligna TaxID=75948 RepID=A0AA35Y1A5_LACSI|nr:unnamed protein product [Lactuca saligna]
MGINGRQSRRRHTKSAKVRSSFWMKEGGTMASDFSSIDSQSVMASGIRLRPKKRKGKEKTLFVFGKIDVKKLQLKWLQAQMGLVSQEHALFGTSIRENIMFGKIDATIEEVIAAATTANAHNFIRSLLEGYETMVGEIRALRG